MGHICLNPIVRVSDSRTTHHSQTLKAFNVLELCEVVVCGDKPGPPLPPKPDPKQLQHIAAEAGVDLDRDGVVMVGDTWKVSVLSDMVSSI